MLGHSTALACFGLRRHGEGGPHSSLHRQRPENQFAELARVRMSSRNGSPKDGNQCRLVRH